MVDQPSSPPPPLPRETLDISKLTLLATLVSSTSQIVAQCYASAYPGLSTWRTAMDRWETEMIQAIDEYRKYRGL